MELYPPDKIKDKSGLSFELNSSVTIMFKSSHEVTDYKLIK